MQIKSRIESRSNPKVIWARGLSERKNRQKEGLFRFEGIKLFSEALREKLDIVCVFATEKALALFDGVLRHLTAKYMRFRIPFTKS